MEIEIQGRKTEHVTVTVDQSELVEKPSNWRAVTTD